MNLRKKISLIGLKKGLVIKENTNELVFVEI